MCDYCDCRTRPLLDRLGRDHERILSTVHRLRATAWADDVKATAAHAQELHELLEAHDRLEEAGLYTELDRTGIATAELRAEHDAMARILAATANGASPPAADIARALDGLEDHIRSEEYDLFPAAHQLIDDAGWDRIQRTMEMA